MWKTTAAVALVLTVVTAAPLGAVDRPLTPLVLGWEQFFKLDWQFSQGRNQPVVWGHILNDWGMPAARVQLLVEGLDAKGQVVGQKVAWLGSTLSPGIRDYFEVPVPWQVPTYRVSVFAFDWVQTDGNGGAIR
jgi:hypothetical protein